MRVGIVGSGVVGAAIAYELSQLAGLSVTVVDRQRPAQAATGAALGVLMGVISQKAKGRLVQLRLDSIARYELWLPELEARTGVRIPCNRQGILRLCLVGESLDDWRSLMQIRQTQGWPLELLSCQQLARDFPQLNLERVVGAVYSPCDRQIDPVALTSALVTAAAQNGVRFELDTEVTGLVRSVDRCSAVQTTGGQFEVDWLVIAAGLGSTGLTEILGQPVMISPVLGQAVRVRLPKPLGYPDHQPVITGEDTHIVPLGEAEYWLGATVEFTAPDQPGQVPIADAANLQAVMDRAIDLCPPLAEATVLHQWSGLRPRPEGRPAPVIDQLAGYKNVLLATGHYRNGILLAPATADRVKALITA